MTLLEAALAILCRTHAPACVAAVTEAVPLVADTAAAHGVDPVLAVAVCTQESRLLTRPAQSLCGTYRTRDPEASAAVAAHALARWRRRCDSVDSALLVYHYGRGCDALDPDGYVHQVRAIERRLRCAMASGRRCW